MITKTKVCNHNRYTHTQRSKTSIKWIVVHYTAGEGSPTVQNSLDFFARTSGQSSAHFFVDEHDVGSSVPWYFPAWHCGSSNGYKHKSCRNYNSLGVELCSEEYGDHYWITDETLDRGARFVAWLMWEFNIPLSNVIRHYDVTGKLCPLPLVEEESWQKFKSKVFCYYYDLTHVEEVEEVKYFEKIDEIPEWYRPTIQKLIDAGHLKGTGKGLHLSEDMCRILTIVDNAGGFM